MKPIDNCVNIVVRNKSSYLSISLCWNSFGQRDLLSLQIVKYFFTKHYKLTASINVFSCIVASCNVCKLYGRSIPIFKLRSTRRYLWLGRLALTSGFLFLSLFINFFWMTSWAFTFSLFDVNIPIASRAFPGHDRLSTLF